MSDAEETTEQANRTEHKEDQRDYQRDRLEDKTVRVEKAAALEVERVAKASELAAVAHEKARAHRRIAYAQLAAYLLILAVCVAGWQIVEQLSEDRATDSRDRDAAICEASQDNREATRGVVSAIEELGTRLVLGGEAGTITPEQQQALDEFAAFKAEQLALLDGPACE